MPKGVFISLFADDIAIWARHVKVQEAVDRIASWSEGMKLRLNSAKCECSFFSTASHEATHQPKILILGTPLNVTKSPVFLGITLDRTLSFGQHVAKVCTKVESRCRLLGAVASRDWGCKRKTLRQLFFDLVRGTMNYCGAVWQPWLTNVERLERAQCKAIRCITGHAYRGPENGARCPPDQTSDQLACSNCDLESK